MAPDPDHFNINIFHVVSPLIHATNNLLDDTAAHSDKYFFYRSLRMIDAPDHLNTIHNVVFCFCAPYPDKISQRYRA
jgi:hypothetical protein